MRPHPGPQDRRPSHPRPRRSRSIAPTAPNIGRISGEPDRLLEVEWEQEDEPAFTVQLRTRSWDRTHLLTDISRAISDTGANIRESTTRTASGIAEQDFSIDVADVEQLRQAIDANRTHRGRFGSAARG